MAEAGCDDGQGGFRGKDSGKFPAKLRVAAKFAAQQDAVAGEAKSDGAGWACFDALAAGQAALPVELWAGFRPGKGDSLLSAGGKAGAALRAGRAAPHRKRSADQADVDNLGPGATVGAIGHGDPELVVQLERAGNPALHEFFQVVGAQQGFKPLGKILPGVDAVGAAALPEAGLQGKALHFVLLVVQG